MALRTKNRNPSEKEKFKIFLKTEVERISRREKLSNDQAFLFWFATQILELSDDDAREAISVEGANDKGIDLFWVDDDEGRVIIAQGKYSSGLTLHPKIAQVAKLESSLNWLCNPEELRREGKIDLAQAAEDYVKAVEDGYGVELWFVYTGPKCANIDKHISVYNQNPDNLAKRRVLRHYHADILLATQQEIEGVYQRIPSEDLTIVEGQSLLCKGQFGEAMVVSLPASEIIRLYEKYGDRLFDRNVRLFLGVRKGSVNAGIAETLGDDSQRGNFWAYNNGITIICDKFASKEPTVNVKNFSIVNGCQTTVSLAQGVKNGGHEVSVLTRIIAASAEIVDEVIRFTNSQNPIRTWDIASQDRTQRRLKKEFNNLAKPYIYLTRRGARPTGDLSQYRDGRKLRQIRIDIMGQYAAAFRSDPVLAYKHKAFIFSRHHDTVFPPDVRAKEILFQWICGETCKSAVQSAIGGKKDEEVRILKKGGTLFVLAVMSKIFSFRNGSTFLKSLTEQRITSKTTARQLQKYAEYAVDKYVQAVLDQIEIENEELPTLIRSRDFYTKVIGRIERAYNTDSRASKWISEALPKIYK